MPTARFWLPAGSYTGDFPGTVPALTAGTIVQTSPIVGDTLTVTGSNAPTGSTFLWQIDSGGWTDAAGTNNAASYTTAGTGSFRRGVSTPGQAMVFTPAVTVAAGTVSDNFNRADEDLTASANWSLSQTSTTKTANIVSNQLVVADTATGGHNVAWKYNATFGPSQFAKATYITMSFASDVGPCVCLAPLGARFRGYGVVRSNAVLALQRYNGDAASVTIGSVENMRVTGQVLTIERNDATSELTVKLNGTTVIGPIVDATYSGGDIGIGGFVGFTHSSTWDDFEGGNL